MTTYTTKHSLPIIEPTVDLIKDDGEVSALAGDINALAQATEAGLESVVADATTKYGGLPDRVTTLEGMQPVKAVRLEGTQWVWDLAGATHYLFPEPGGGLAVHATAWPVPAATPSLDW